MPLLLGPPLFVFLCLAELVTKSATWILSFMSQRCGNIFPVVFLPTSGISEIYYYFCNSKDKSKQKSGNPEMWIHKYLLKFHCICLFLTTLCVRHWVFYTYRCNVLRLSSASQLFPGILPTWHAAHNLITSWMSNTNFSPLIHICIKDSSVLIQHPSMKLQFQYSFCQLVSRCLIHPIWGESLVDPVCVVIYYSSYLFACYFSIQIWDHGNWPVTLSNSHKRCSLNKNCYN